MKQKQVLETLIIAFLSFKYQVAIVREVLIQSENFIRGPRIVTSRDIPTMSARLSFSKGEFFFLS